MLESLAHYKILDRIGAGGMGEVYRARDTRLGRTVAIKVLAADVANDPDRRERFLREARASAALSHPNIAALYEIGEDQGHVFLALEYVPGEPLNAVIGGRPMNPRRAINLAVQIADALADAHAEGIVHRDIKPANIIVTPKGNAKILDFGLATWTAGGAEREHAADAATVMATTAGTTLGTVAYMSPEQALGERVDERTDIFSLGIVLFEMLTGRLPFSGATSTALALQIVQAQAPPPSALNRSVPRDVDPIVGKALAKSLDQRYESAATLAAELRSIVAILDVRAETHANEPATAPITTRPRRTSYAGWILLLLLLAALAAIGWWKRADVQRMWHRTLGPAPAPVIAVIPLDLAGADVSQTYFADGLTEDLITRLGQTPGLRVLGRSATRDYRGRAPREVATELGAGAVLTGSVRPSGDTMKISLELIDPSDGTAIWSNQYTREITDTFKVQAQVAEDVAQALRVTLKPTPSSTRAASRLVDAKAYELYLRGRQATAQRQLPDAIKLFEAAIAGDAGLGEAFAGLAEALHFDAVYNAQPDEPLRRQRLKAAADRASQLDPDLPQANLAMGLAADGLSKALGSMRRAVELDPSYGEGYHSIGDQIEDFDPEHAGAFYQRSLQLDPRLDVNRSDLALVFHLLNRPEDARRALSGVGDVTGWRTPLTASIALDEHRYEDALAALRAAPRLRDSLASWLAYVVALRTANQVAEASQEVKQLVKRFPDSCDARAMLAGLTLERGAAIAARQLAAQALSQASRPDAIGSQLRCGVLTAAAIDDAGQAAALLGRVAEREEFVRGWAIDVRGQTGAMALRGQVYPWNKVIDKPPMVAAKQRMDAAYARERDIAKAALDGLP